MMAFDGGTPLIFHSFLQSSKMATGALATCPKIIGGKRFIVRSGLLLDRKERGRCSSLFSIDELLQLIIDLYGDRRRKNPQPASDHNQMETNGPEAHKTHTPQR